MERGDPNSTAVAHKLRNSRQFALKSMLIGGFAGGGTTMAVGGPLAQQLAQAAVLSAVISLCLYWLLGRLAAWVTDETADSVIQSRTEPTQPQESSATQ